MTESLFVHDRLPDDELVAEVKRLTGCERQATARLIAALAELDARRLYLGQGCSSMFTYCTQVLHLAEHAAYNRIEAARAARRFPAVLMLLADGSVHLSAVRLLAPHLTADNHIEVLGEASHKSKREVEQIVAHLQPQPDVVASLRKLPATRPARAPVEPRTPQALPSANAVAGDVPSFPRSDVSPLAPERYKVQFTVGRETYEKLRRVQDLLRHRVPNGDPAVIFDRAITLLLEDLEKKKRIAATEHPRPPMTGDTHPRHIPAEVRRVVWARDGGRCRFEGPEGGCTETGFLEFHHVVPYAAGGSTTTDNLELRCAAHNRYEAEQYFGRGTMFMREERESEMWSDGQLRLGPS